MSLDWGARCVGICNGTKAHIPLETGFALGTQREGIGSKQHEIYMPNASPSRRGHWPPIFHLLVLGVGVGVTQILAFALGVMQILAFLDTNLLVSPMRNCGVGGLIQCEDPTRMVLRRSGI